MNHFPLECEILIEAYVGLPDGIICQAIRRGTWGSYFLGYFTNADSLTNAICTGSWDFKHFNFWMVKDNILIPFACCLPQSYRSVPTEMIQLSEDGEVAEGSHHHWCEATRKELKYAPFIVKINLQQRLAIVWKRLQTVGQIPVHHDIFMQMFGDRLLGLFTMDKRESIFLDSSFTPYELRHLQSLDTFLSILTLDSTS